LTLNHVAIVVDSGLARRPRYDRGAGLTRLVTERASRAAITQRAGRAARQSPGVAIRLWEEAANASLAAHDPPEILDADLASAMLTCLLWGESDITRLPWLDPPPASAIAEARDRLSRLGAIGADGQVTPHGRAIAALPLEPRLAHMLIEAGERGFAQAAAETALLLSERGLGGNDVDLETRHRGWLSDRSQRSEAAKRMAKGWTEKVRSSRVQSRDAAIAQSIALAFPDRLSRRRDSSGESWQSVGGRGFRLGPAHPLARSEWLAVAEVAGAASGARILSASAIDLATIESLFADRIEQWSELTFDTATGAVTALKGRRLGSIKLASAPDPKPDQTVIEAALIEAVRCHGLALLPWSENAAALRTRTAFARAHATMIPDLSDESLHARLDEWLPPLLHGRRRLDAIDPSGLRSTLDALIGYDASRQLDRIAPPEFVSPADSHHLIDYAAAGGPTVEVRAQALYGLKAHPMVANGEVPLTLAITSPAGRPIQTSRDLPAFWAGSWRDVAKEMRGRYPKHPWPDDPANALPTLRTKRAST
jgi:ATP-dependent helicase HrpB